MTTNVFQGKWAIKDSQTNNYLSGGSNGISPGSSTITPSATFILYCPGPVFGPGLTFQGYVQLQGNMQYIASHNFSSEICELAASAPDQSSAVMLAWTLPAEFLFALDINTGQSGEMGIIDENGVSFWGYYNDENQHSFVPDMVTILTPGIYQMQQSQSQSWPNLDFSFVDLTGQNFSGNYQFQNCNFQQAVLVQVNFTGANLSGANFSGASLAGIIFSGATLSGANLTGGVLSQMNLSGINFSGANFSGATLAGTNFTGATLSSANFSGCDLTTIIYDSTTIVAPTQSARGSFNSARLPFTLINRLWQWLDLTNSTVSGIPSPLSSSANVLQATGARFCGMNQNGFTGVILENAVLNYADLDGVDMSSADLTNASLVQASLHGTNLSGATMTGANMSGAQFGSLGYLFTLPLSMASDLNAGNVSALTSYFTQLGISLSSTAKLETVVYNPTLGNEVWELNDVGNNLIYTIRLNGPGAQVYTVYWPAAPANMVNAYMPNAVLTGANLYGVLANNIQFYGSGAKIDGSAILELAEFNGSNLSNVDFTQAQLMGANLSDSYLFNAKFNNANLTPSTNGNIPTNLSNANLQGADFTDARLFSANMKNAAMAINVPTKANSNQGGVYLFSLPYNGDSNTLQQYIDELDAAGLTLFSLNPNGDQPTLQKYVNALNAKNLATVQVPFLQQSPPITFSSNAQIISIEAGSVWQIVDLDRSYTLWTDVDESGDTELYAASSLTNTQAAFQQNGITLRWQASVTLDTLDQQWLLDNDSENPQNRSTGYMSFLLMVNGSVLDVYGTAIRILRLGDNNQLEYDTETCNVTVLSVTNMSGTTICPNGITLAVNQTQNGETWDQRWLRASTPPKPPTCVPTDNSWCPTTSTSSVAQRTQVRGAD